MDFVSEDDLATFEGWLRYQAVDPALLTPSELAMWRGSFEETRRTMAPGMGVMRLRSVPGERRYAVAVRDGTELWLALWVRCSPKGEFFVLIPRAGGDWNPHTSYHKGGAFHMKSFDRKFGPPQTRQALTASWRGTEHLGVYAGHAPKRVGAVCDPTAFSGVVEVAPGVLGPRGGLVAVDLVQPGHNPIESSPSPVVARRVFEEAVPWVVITVHR